MKKVLDTKGITNELRGASVFFPTTERVEAEEDQVENPSEGAEFRTESRSATLPPQSELEIQEQEEPTYKVTQVSKRLSNPLSKSLSKSSFHDLSTDMIETLAFQLRKRSKFRVNADIPEEWKDELDDIAYRLKVGKYDLMTYIIAQFLKKLEQS